MYFKKGDSNQYSVVRKKILNIVFLLFLSLIADYCLLTAYSYAEIQSVEWSDLSDKNITAQGKAALTYHKSDWKHAESEHFVYHYTDEKETETVTIHSEVYYKWVKELFGVTEDIWKTKAHVFVFQNKDDWKDFSSKNGAGIEGDAFTNGQELFIYREPYYLAPKKALAHEMTHVILFRFLKGPIPLSLNEGFAEFMSYKAIAMQEGVGDLDIRVLQLLPPEQYIPLKDITAMTQYPKDQAKVMFFYQESELLARFLLLNWKGEKFYNFLQTLSKGEPFFEAIGEVYGFEKEKFEEDFKNFAIKKIV